MNEQIKEQLDRIERYSLLAAKNVLRLDEVALLTGLSKSKLYKMTCGHQIPHYKPNGKQMYFDRMEIEDWMRQNRVSTDDEIAQKADEYIATTQIERHGHRQTY